MGNRIICGRPLSARELAWGLAALIALTVAFGTLIWYPIFGIMALGVSLAALERGGFFGEFKRLLRNIRDTRWESYLLKYQRK
jgi:hypothetical protein